jgi:tetratricopeptide (TPR) repeat protein
MREISIFVSSPGDVAEERLIAARVIARLAHRFAERAVLKPCFWEHLPLRASASFQEEIPRSSKFDVVVMILWSRIGTRLPKDMLRPDGTRYESGTEFEFEDAIRHYEEHGLPHVLVYRKTASLMVDLATNQERWNELSRQKEHVDRFFQRRFRDDEGLNAGANHSFADTSEFEEKFEQHLRALFEEILAASGKAGPHPVACAIEWNPQLHGSPFRGLQRFDFEHRSIYFGRTKAINEVLGMLRWQGDAGCPFVLVFGNSGAGKSSFLRAGVLPFLVEPGVIEGVGVWKRAIFEPSDSTGDLLDGLAAAFFAPEGLPDLARAMSEAQLAAQLRDFPETVVPLLQRELGLLEDALQRERPVEVPRLARFALVIDPLEEVFTRPGASAEDRERFFRALEALARSKLVWILASMRSDFYERCAEHPRLLELKSVQGQYHLPPPTLIEKGLMIRLPARLAGLQFEESADQGKLDEVLLNAASSDPGALPLLQFTLDELYQRSHAWETGLLTFKTYHALGGLQGAVRTRAEETLAEVEKMLGPRLEGTFSAVFSALVGLKQEVTQRAVRLYSQRNRLIEDPDRKIFVEAFIAARLFMADVDDEKQPVITLGHEALLQHWPRLADWIEKNHDFLRERDRLVGAARHWREKDCDAAFLLAEGKPLANGRELLLKRRSGFEPSEIDFLEASIAHADQRRKRARRRSRAVFVGVSALAILAAIMAAVSIAKAYEAAAKAREAEASLETAEYRRVIAMNSLISASEAREESDLRADESEKLAQFLFDDIGVRLQPSDPQNRALVGIITEKTLIYYGNLQIEDEPPARKADHARDVMNVAKDLEKIGRFKEALQFGRRIIALLDSDHSIQAPKEADVFDLVGRCENQLGNYAEAETSYKEALRLTRKGDSNRLNEELGELYRHLGRYAESERLLRIPAGTKPTPSRLHSLGELYRYEDRLPEAEQRLLEGRQLTQENAKAVAKSNAQLLEERQKAVSVEKIQRLDIEIGKLQPAVEKANDDIARAKSDLGVLRFEQKRYPEAEQLLRESLAAGIKSRGNEHPLVAAEQYKLARVLTRVGKFEEADEMLHESRQTLTIAFSGEPNQRMAKCLEAFAALRLAQSRFDEAQTFAEQVLTMRQALFKPPHPELWKALEALEEISIAINDSASATSMRREIDAMKTAFNVRESAILEQAAAVR